MVLAAIDLTFAAAVLAVAIFDPTSAEAWGRWGLVVVADVSAGFGIVKLAGLRRVSTPATGSGVT